MTAETSTTSAPTASVKVERFISRSWVNEGTNSQNVRRVEICERSTSKDEKGKDIVVDTVLHAKDYELPANPIGLSSFQAVVFRNGLQSLFDQAAGVKDADGDGSEAFGKFADRCADLLADRLPVRGRKSIDGQSALDILAEAYARVSGKTVEFVKTSFDNLAAKLSPEAYAEKLKAIRLNASVAAELAKIEAERKAKKAAAATEVALPDLF